MTGVHFSYFILMYSSYILECLQMHLINEQTVCVCVCVGGGKGILPKDAYR